MNKTIQQQRNGFTLVEVAIVIVFMGIFITFASSMLKGIALSSKSRAAREKLANTSDAVQAWAVNKREIPVNSNSFNLATGNPLDYWNKQYTFHSYSTQVHDVCRWSGTSLAVCPGGSCAGKIIKDIGYVILSGGDNQTIQTASTTIGCPAGVKCIPLPEISTTYDDLYKYVTLLELKKTVGCVEADSRLRILNGDLPAAQLGSRYDVSIWADGGQPLNNTYTWSVTPASVPANLVTTNAYKPDSGTTRFRIYSTPVAPAAPAYLTLTVTDSVGATATKSFLLTVK